MTILGQGLNFGGFGGRAAGVAPPSGSPKGWWDVSQLVASADDPIASLPDSTGNGYNLVQTQADEKPLYKENSINTNMPSLLFDGTDDNLMVSFAGSTAQPYTIFVVLRIETKANSKFYHGGYTARGGESLWNANFNAYAGAFLASGDIPGNNTWNLWTILYNGASSTIRKNGSQVGATANVGAAGSDGVTLGAFGQTGNPGGHAHCSIAEFIIYHGTENPAANEAALATKWGL